MRGQEPSLRLVEVEAARKRTVTGARADGAGGGLPDLCKNGPMAGTLSQKWCLEGRVPRRNVPAMEGEFHPEHGTGMERLDEEIARYDAGRQPG